MMFYVVTVRIATDILKLSFQCLKYLFNFRPFPLWSRDKHYVYVSAEIRIYPILYFYKGIWLFDGSVLDNYVIEWNHVNY